MVTVKIPYYIELGAGPWVVLVSMPLSLWIPSILSDISGLI
jgi:hypothetical protein